MTLDEFQEKIELSKESRSLYIQIEELLELFADLANLECISYYRYNYEYNDFFYKFTINSNGEKVDEPSEDTKSTKIHLEKGDIVYGYIEIYEEYETTPIIEKLLRKTIKYLELQREYEKKLAESL